MFMYVDIQLMPATKQLACLYVKHWDRAYIPRQHIQWWQPASQSGQTMHAFTVFCPICTGTPRTLWGQPAPRAAVLPHAAGAGACMTTVQSLLQQRSKHACVTCWWQENR